jgi:para-aminobenzoate synthetase/4-amino-4-deoxychorismate lyase
MITVTAQSLYAQTGPWVLLHGDASGFPTCFFSSPRAIIQALRPEDVLSALDAWDVASKTSYCVGYISYEAGYVLQGLPVPEDISEPLVWFAVFDRTDECVVDFSDVQPRGDIHFLPLRAYEEYAWELSRIKKHIAAGDTYQVNFSFSLDIYADDPVGGVYARLCGNQQAGFRAVMRTGDRDIISLSPELFFRKSGRTITVRPMKGTASRGSDIASDDAIKASLAKSDKDRAENLMIVDLMRNDLGKIAEAGSVRVSSLFDVETHMTVHQMTSTVEAYLRDGVSYRAIIEALFPCGSVTGAPKRRTMEIIRSCERASRGVYCGAIGFSAPSGDAVFSVAIRTLEKKAGPHEWSMRVGSGVVWDSVTKAEWDECLVKAAFLTRKPLPTFSLVETMYWDGTCLVLREEHLARLRDSAQYFSYRYDRAVLEKAWGDAVFGLTEPCVLRSLLSKDGNVTCEAKPLIDRGVRSVTISSDKVESGQIFLHHKTTYRPWYESAMVRIAAGEVFDVLFCNERGEICEGAISNVFVKIKGVLYTPPVSCGLLNGTLRRSMIAKGEVLERVIFPRDLRAAEAVYCGNSVRGLVKVACRS